MKAITLHFIFIFLTILSHSLFISCSNPEFKPKDKLNGKIGLHDENTVHKRSTDQIKTRIEQWNNAHNIKDRKTFTDLFYNSVNYYGKYSGTDDCVNKKMEFLDSIPDYYQSIIDSIEFKKLHDDTFKCLFKKKAMINNNMHEFTSYLVFHQFERNWYIINENDTLTDK